MGRRLPMFLSLSLIAIHLSQVIQAGGDDPVAKAKTALAPRLIDLRKPTRLSAILGHIHRETDNLVVDRRKIKSDPILEVSFSKTPFWEALHFIASKSDCRVSVYQADGRIALIDGPEKSGPTHRGGIFRVAAKRITLTRDLEADTQVCAIALDVAWEPRFEPFYLDVGPVEVVYAPWAKQKPQIEKVASRGQMTVSGRVATEVEMRFPGPPRKVAEIELLRGTLKAIGPSKMLDFTFDKLEPIKKGEGRLQTKEDVKVTLSGFKAGSERWTVDVLIENPAGGPVFESFQTWLDNNRIALVRGKETWVPEAEAEEQLEPLTAQRAHIRYYFTVKGRKSDPGSWMLHYRTPGRIVEVTAPFTLKNLPLP